MGNTRDTGYLQNLVTYDASGNIVLPANLTVNGNLLVATQSYVTTQISNLINGAPALLDTLDELAAALGDDASFASTITTSIAGKQAQLNGTGFVKVTGTTISYDNSTYLTTGSASSTYQTILSNPVIGTGTTSYLPKFTGTSTIGNSALYDGGGFGGFNSTGLGSRTFVINAASGRPLAIEAVEFANVHSISIRPNNTGFNIISSNYVSGGTFLPLSLSGRENSSDLVLQTSGNVSIGTTTDNGAKLQVSGFARFDRGTLQFTLNPSYAGGNVYSQLQSTGSLALATGGDNNRLYIDSSGAATFSSSVADYAATITNIQDDSQGLLVRATDNDGGLYLIRAQSSNSSVSQTWVDRFTLAKNGAATFSSNVTANGLNAIGSTLNNGNAIRFYRAGLTEMGYIGWSDENTNNSTWLFKSSNGNPIAFSPDGINQEVIFNTDGSAFFNYPILGSRSFVFRTVSGRPLTLETIALTGIHSLYLRPNDSGRHLISSNYLSGGVYLPLALSGRENDSDLVLAINGNVLIGTTTDNGNRFQVSGAGTFSSNISTNGGLFAIGDVLTTGGRLLASNGNQSANAESASILLGNRGYFSTSDIGAARISAVSTGANWYNGTALAFYTNPGPDVTSTGAVERMRINSTGVVRITNLTSNGLIGTDSSGNIRTVLSEYTEIATGTITYSMNSGSPWAINNSFPSTIRDYNDDGMVGSGGVATNLNIGRGITFDLGSAKAVRRIVERGYPTKNLNTIIVQYSTDNSNWTDIYVYNHIYGNTQKTMEFNPTGAISARYWRWFIHSWSEREVQNYYTYECIIYT